MYLTWPARVFQMWAYEVGHHCLLLRSTIRPPFNTRVDVLFKGVDFVRLPARLSDLAISQARTDELDSIITETGMVPDEDRKFFVIRSGSFTGLVVASIVFWSEDQGEFYEPSEVWPNELGTRNR